MKKGVYSSFLKAELISNGVTLGPGVLEGVGKDFKEEYLVYDDSNFVPENEKLLMPGEVLLPDDIVANFDYRPSSPYSIEMKDKQRFLIRDDKKVSKIDFLPRPKVWDHVTSDGLPMKSVANIYGLDAMSLWKRNICSYFDKGKQCHFCGINRTQKKYKVSPELKTNKQIQETVEAAMRLDKPEHLIFIGGCFSDRDTEIREYIKDINTVGEIVDYSKIEAVPIIMPPNDFKLIDKLHNTGIPYTEYNLEIFDPVLFQKLCPGKAEYGREKFFDAYRHSVNVFGEGQVRCNFVFGLEDTDRLVKGCWDLADMGVVTSANVFHPGIGTPLQNRKSPSSAEIIRFFKHLGEIYNTFGYKPFYCEKSLRTSLGNEAKLGYLDDITIEKGKVILPS